MELEPSNKTKEVFEKYLRATKYVNESAATLRSAETALANARIELGKWLTPDDAKEGETFNMWYGDGILSVKVIRFRSEFEISWRKKPTKEP